MERADSPTINFDGGWQWDRDVVAYLVLAPDVSIGWQMDACQEVGADKVASGVGVQRDIFVAHGAAVRVGANSVALGAISHPCSCLNGSKVVAEVGDDSIADGVGSLVWRSHLWQMDGAAGNVR